MQFCTGFVIMLAINYKSTSKGMKPSRRKYLKDNTPETNVTKKLLTLYEKNKEQAHTNTNTHSTYICVFVHIYIHLNMHKHPHAIGYLKKVDKKKKKGKM